jgi:hypothetical protein
MKKLLILILAISLYGCLDEEKIVPVPESKSNPLSDASYVEYKIVLIDSCEYIFGHDNGTYNGGYFLSHKGNCKNPIHYKNFITVTDTVEYIRIKK